MVSTNYMTTKLVIGGQKPIPHILQIINQCQRMRQYVNLKSYTFKQLIITTSHTNLSMSKHKYDVNYLTAENGCIVTQQSSQRERGPASSLLSSDPNSVWVTANKLPQECTISLKRMARKPLQYNTIGFYAWHEYDSNPALVQLWIRVHPQAQKWQLISKIRLNRADTWQYFKIQDIQADKLRQIKIVIIENFGDTKTYLNKIGLFCGSYVGARENIRQESIDEQYQSNIPNAQGAHKHSTSISNTPAVVSKYLSTQNTNSNTNKNQPRQKTHSQYQKHDKYQQTQKQLKRAHDRIGRLTQQQQTMKDTILQQEKIIIKIQETLKAVLLNMHKMHKIETYGRLSREVQEIMPSEGKKPANTLNNEQESYDDEHEEQEARMARNKKIFNKNTSKNRQIQQLRRNLKKLQKQQLLTGNFGSKGKQKLRSKQKQKQSEYKSSTHDKNQKKSNNKYSQTQTPIHYAADVIRANSEDDLSQFSHPNYSNTNYGYRTSQAGVSSAMGSAAKGNQAIMYERLLKLLELKQRKKLQLKKSATKTGSKSRAKRMSLYEQANDGSNSEDENYHEAGYY